MQLKKTITLTFSGFDASRRAIFLDGEMHIKSQESYKNKEFVKKEIEDNYKPFLRGLYITTNRDTKPKFSLMSYKRYAENLIGFKI